MRTVLVGLGLIVAPAAALAGPAATGTDDSTFVRQSHRRAVFQFDQRFSILNGKVVGINGLKGGIEWRGRWRAGLGVYRLSGGVPTRIPQPLEFPAGTRDEVRFRYLAAYGEYVFIGNRRWELSAPLQLGLGNYYTKYYFPDGGVLRTNRQVLYMVEPSVAAHYRVFRWVGLGAGTGYRQVFASGEKPEDQISGYIFFGRVKLFLGDFIKVVRGHERLFSQRGLDQH
ncbi:hypothetical protein [Hymenobacter rigui]|uniref:DUF3575 domain-containing protein n=1 Tax=Hymenobacter rigui TaxID=334424 RepID=A0A428KQK9_9BACT|nr:hypothetical protein [Hymenobacter rigui]RSK48791.1 hypothetical protein EI291_09490 [Hymenobacter rigui]